MRNFTDLRPLEREVLGNAIKRANAALEITKGKPSETSEPLSDIVEDLRIEFGMEPSYLIDETSCHKDVGVGRAAKTVRNASR